MIRHIEISGNQIAYKQVVNDATKPTIVFLHDSLGCIKLWRDFPEKLAEQTNLNYLVYDRLGYGNSDPSLFEREPNYMELEAEFLEELLQELNLNQVILFGHSDGGTISLLHASKYPKRILGLISEAAHIFVEPVTIKGINDALELFNSTNLEERLKKYHGEKAKDVFFAWTDIWTRDDYLDWNIEHFLPKIKCPVLIIQGTEDEYGTTEQVNGIVKSITGEKEVFMPTGLKHTPHKEKPDLILQKSGGFINSIVFN
jgi:pimeloyl-ACP methyl ester carboxylesterase